MNAVRGPLLVPRPGGAVDFIADGLLAWDAAGLLTFVGPHDGRPAEASVGVLMPPLLDCHIHIPQWPIRGHFCDGVGHGEHGRLLAGLNRNVFPAEARCGDPAHAAALVEQFRRDTLANGVVGGAAYMTVHAAATRAGLAGLGDLWHVGLVLMNQNCPDYLRTADEWALDSDDLAIEFAGRFILTDRFAVAVDSNLRREAVRVARDYGLRMQTHLNEQPAEKAFVEQELYPGQTYTGVYDRDGLLDCQPILAHCIHMRPAEWDQIVGRAAVAHCPTSNALLGSGIMRLDEVIDRGIPYAICTDVGASPTTSLLAEMSVFLRVHAGRSRRATPSEALYRTTLAAADLLGVGDRVGTLAVGRPASFIEVEPFGPTAGLTADEVIAAAVLGLEPADGVTTAAVEALGRGGLEDAPSLATLAADVGRAAGRLEGRVVAVTLGGRPAWGRG